MCSAISFGPKVRPDRLVNNFARIPQQNREPLQSRPASTSYGRRCNYAAGHHVRNRAGKRRRAGSAAVEELQSAARQKDPKEFDRLSRYGLALIERARTIGQRRRRAGSVEEEPVPRR